MRPRNLALRRPVRANPRHPGRKHDRCHLPLSALLLGSRAKILQSRCIQAHPFPLRHDEYMRPPCRRRNDGLLAGDLGAEVLRRADEQLGCVRLGARAMGVFATVGVYGDMLLDLWNGGVEGVQAEAEACQE